jgi:hypothetical protein
MNLIIREVIEIELHRYNISREGGFCLSNSWKPLIGSLKASCTLPRSAWQSSTHPMLNLYSVYCKQNAFLRSYGISLSNLDT